MVQKNSRYTKQIKVEACRRYKDGESVVSIINDLNIRHRDNVYNWVKEYEIYGDEAFNRKRGRPKKATPEAQLQRMERMQDEIDMLKKGLEILSRRE